MRIISGTARGRTLKTAVAPGLRPAMAKTREALFSMLEARGVIWEDSTVLDLYAGSGSLALECVSRGAKMAWLVDNSKDACASIKYNIEALEMNNECRVFDMDVLRFLRSQTPFRFNIVFIDPPYRRNLATATLELLGNGLWLEKNAFIICEAEKNLQMEIPDSFESVTAKDFGQTTLHIWNFK